MIDVRDNGDVTDFHEAVLIGLAGSRPAGSLPGERHKAGTDRLAVFCTISRPSAMKGSEKTGF
ncbi:hypothetical protein JCM15831A_24910 [Asaia astilbis]